MAGFVSIPDTTTTSQPHFHLSVVIYTVAAVFELLSEPLYIQAQDELRLNALLSCQSRSSPSWSLRSPPVDGALVPFAASQAEYGLSLMVALLGVYKGGINYVPERVPKDEVAWQVCVPSA